MKTQRDRELAESARFILAASERDKQEDAASANGVREHGPPVDWSLSYLFKAQTDYLRRYEIDERTASRIVSAQGELIAELNRATYLGHSKRQSATDVAWSFRCVVNRLSAYAAAGASVAWERLPSDLAAAVAAVREGRLDWKAVFVKIAADRVRRVFATMGAKDAESQRAIRRALLWLMGGVWKSLGRIAKLRLVSGSFVRAKERTNYEKFERDFVRRKRPELRRLFLDCAALEAAPDLLVGMKSILAYLDVLGCAVSPKTAQKLVHTAGLPLNLGGRGVHVTASKSALWKWCEERGRVATPAHGADDVAGLISEEGEKARRADRGAIDGQTVRDIAPGVVEKD